MSVRANTFIDSDVMNKMTENNPLLAMMTDSEAIKENTEAWMKLIPGAGEAPINGLAAHPMAAMAASSAIGLGIYSQLLGTMFGAMTSAMEAAETHKGDMPVFNPLTFEWTGASFEKQGAKPAAQKTQAPAEPHAPNVGEDSPSAHQPPKIEKPQKPDDLKLISGVGPKLETVLNGLGIWTFAQIAEWSVDEIAWVDEFLQFRGRIERDEWLRQAAALSEA